MKITKNQIANIKIIVCDLDGTLFNHNKQISRKTINYLIELQQSGYILVLATGRFFYELDRYIEQLQLKKYHGYVVCCNGTEIHNLYQQQTKHFISLEHDDIDQLIKLSNQHKLNIRVNYDNKYQMILTSPFYRLIPLIRLFTKRYPDLLFYHTNEVVAWSNLGKICLISSPKKLSRFQKEAEDKFPQQYQYYYTSKYCIELVKYNINKCYAIEHLCQSLHLSLENVLAFGDSGNDELLLKKVGIGMLMKNGYAPLKRQATYITTKTNQQEGVLETLELLFK